MQLEKLTLYSSLALVGALIAREILKAKVKLRTMAILRSKLEEFGNDETFKTLHFNPFYDNVAIGRDRVELRAHVETTDETRVFMGSIPLEKTGETTPFDNQLNYSAYKLEKANGDLKKVLDHFADATKVFYILFKPVRYQDDNDYLAYELLGADATKQPLREMSSIILQRQASYATVGEVNQSGRPATARALSLSTTSTTRNLYMNPSPPATRSISG